MHVGSSHAPLAVHRLSATPAVGAEATGDRREFGAGQGMVVRVAAQRAFRQLDRLQRQRRQPFLHHRFALEQANPFSTLTLNIGQGVEQVQHAPAFREERFAGRMMGANGGTHPVIFGEGRVVQFRVTAWQIQAICVGQLAVAERRKEQQLGAHFPQKVQARAVEEGEGFIVGDRNAYTGE